MQVQSCNCGCILFESDFKCPDCGRTNQAYDPESIEQLEAKIRKAKRDNIRQKTEKLKRQNSFLERMLVGIITLLLFSVVYKTIEIRERKNKTVNEVIQGEVNNKEYR